MTKYLSDRTPLYKEAAKLMQVITFLSNRMDKDGKDFRQRAGYMTDWLGSMIKQRPLEDISLAKQIIHLQVHLFIFYLFFLFLEKKTCRDKYQYWNLFGMHSRISLRLCYNYGLVDSNIFIHH